MIALFEHLLRLFKPAPVFCLCLATAVASAVASDSGPEPQSLEQILHRSVSAANLATSYSVDLKTTITIKEERPRKADSVGQEIFVSHLNVDGERIDLASTSWGVSKGKKVPEFRSRDIYTDGQMIHRQQFLGKGLRQIQAFLAYDPSSRKRLLGTNAVGFWLFQIPDGDFQPVAQTILDSIQFATLSPREEEVDGHPCFVIKAKLAGGDYTIWVDPKVNYNFRRIRVIKTLGDLAYGEKLPTAPSSTTEKLTLTGVESEISSVRIEQVGSRFAILAGKLASRKIYGQQYAQMLECQCDRSNLKLEPKFAGTKAFEMDGIPNGTAVYISNRHDHLPYVWRNGKVVPDLKDDAVKATDDAIAKEKATVQGR